MVKVLVTANSAVELAGLEALVKSAPSLEWVGSNLGRAGLSQRLADTQPDVLLQSVGASDFDNLRVSGAEGEFAATVVLAPESEFGAALAALQDCSLRGVLPIWADAREIQAAVEAAGASLLVLHPDIAGHLSMLSGEEPLPDTTPQIPARDASASPGQPLSPREAEILNLVASGLGNKEIAWRLKISEHTVKFHVRSIFNKLNASGRAEAVAIGVRRGLIIL